MGIFTKISGILVFLIVGYSYYNAEKQTPKTTPPPLPIAKISTPAEIEKPKESTTHFSSEEQNIIDKILTQFNSKNYTSSLSTAETAFQAAKPGTNFYDWFVAHLPIILTSVAWQQINANNCTTAISLLKRSELFSSHPATSKGLALCYFRFKTLQSAEEYFEKYLEQEQADNQMLILYSEALESSLKYKKALEVLQKAVNNTPEDESIKKRLRTMKEKAQEGLQQVSLNTSHFNLSYHPSNDYDIVDFILETLESSLEEFISKYSFKEPKTPIEVILYPQDRFRKVLGHGPEWASGVFDGRIRVSTPTDQNNASKFSQIETVLRHELTHALFSTMTKFRQIPTWINEGIAQRLECNFNCQPKFFSITQQNFLEPNLLNDPFIELDRVNAELSYHQSLYLILTIENDRNLLGNNPIERIIANIPPTGPLSANRLLKPIHMTFQDLHRQAAKLWNDRVILKPVP